MCGVRCHDLASVIFAIIHDCESQKAVVLTALLNSFAIILIARVKERPSWPHFSIVFAIVPDRENHKAAILAANWVLQSSLIAEITKRPSWPHFL
jgi:hypothetical protein